MNIVIAPAIGSDLQYLAAIEAEAASLFSLTDLPEPLRSTTLSQEVLQVSFRSGLLWVARDANSQVVGYLMASIVDNNFHISQVDVSPKFGRQGIGSRLVDFSLSTASLAGYTLATLTTFKHVRWNAPFYEKFGFYEMATTELGPELASILEYEDSLGLKNRIAMTRELPYKSHFSGSVK